MRPRYEAISIRGAIALAEQISLKPRLASIHMKIELSVDDSDVSDTRWSPEAFVKTFFMPSLQDLDIIAPIELPINETTLLELAASCPRMLSFDCGSTCIVSMSALVSILRLCPELTFLPAVINRSYLPALDTLDGFVHPNWRNIYTLNLIRIGRPKRLAMFIATVLPAVWQCTTHDDYTNRLDRKKVKKLMKLLSEMPDPDSYLQ
jgi:hypothetical protein